MPGAKAVMIVIGIVVLGVAGWFGWGEYQCRGYEDDYLNGISSMRGAIALESIDPDGKLAEVVERTRSDADADITEALEQLYGRCGSRRADNAVRKGQDMLLAM